MTLKPVVILLLLGCCGVSTAWADDPAPDWKDVDNTLVGIHLKVKKAWTEIDLKETPQTGSVTFQLSSYPHVSVTIQRETAQYPFDVWVSSEILDQLYEPGYKRTGGVELAGRSSVKVTGKAKDKEARLEENYFSNKPPYIDQIIFSAPADSWAAAEPDFAALRRSLRWTR